MGYGIDVAAFPMSYDGVLKLTNHEKWIARRQSQEQNFRHHGSFDGIELPRIDDVLLGRGRSYYQHYGNMRMREIVDEHTAAYDEAKVGRKWKIAETIANTIKQSSGRFLERNNDGWWVEVSDEQARKKISKTFASITRARTISKNADQKRSQRGSGDNDDDSISADTESTTGKRQRLTDPYATEERGSRLLVQQSNSSSSISKNPPPSSYCMPNGFCSPRDKT